MSLFNTVRDKTEVLIYNLFQPRITLVIYSRSKDQILHILYLTDIKRFNKSIIGPIYGRDE